MSNGMAMTLPAGLCPEDWLTGPLKLRPGTSPGRGRGVFAVEPIARGELLERVCSVPLASEQCDQLESILPLGDYYFRHPEDAERGLLLLGLTSLANHAEQPNAEIRFVHSDDLGWVAELVSLRPISTGEEITHRYRCEPWFEVG